MRVLVTGATGFVGNALMRRLTAQPQLQVRGLCRRSVELPSRAQLIAGPDLSAAADYSQAVAGCDVVVHLAARVHVMHDSSVDPLAEYRRVNVDGTLKLARQALEGDVRHFIFLSSIKVNGEETLPARPFTSNDAPQPVDPYGVSKLEAEQQLLELVSSRPMNVSILRPPLVYGPGVKANFLQMMRWLSRGVPLPFGAVTGNRRSLIALDNLVDLIATCVQSPCSESRVYLASDGEDLSTADLLQRLAAALGRPARLMAIPPAFLQLLGTVTGRRAQLARLLGSLQIDSSDTRKRLNWQPPVTVDAGLRSAAECFLKEERR